MLWASCLGGSGGRLLRTSARLVCSLVSLAPSAVSFRAPAGPVGQPPVLSFAAVRGYLGCVGAPVPVSVSATTGAPSRRPPNQGRSSSSSCRCVPLRTCFSRNCTQPCRADASGYRFMHKHLCTVSVCACVCRMYRVLSLHQPCLQSLCRGGFR